MKVIIIGGCGFIGSHIVDFLVEIGISVRVLDRKPEFFRPPIPGVDYVIGDLSDISLLTDALSGMDAVVHLASSTVPYTSNLDPAADIMDNLVSFVRLLEAMRAVKVNNILYLSSGGTVYGVPQSGMISEDHPLQPLNSYGIVKVAVEKYLYMHSQLYGLRYCILRASNPYGPRQGHTGIQGVISTFLWKIQRNEQIEIWGDGSIVRDFIHVRDLAELCTRALSSEVSGTFNAGSGQGVSILEVIDIVAEVTGRNLLPAYKSGRNFDVPRVVLDIARAQTSFNWIPRTAMIPGVTETWQWIQQQGSIPSHNAESVVTGTD